MYLYPFCARLIVGAAAIASMLPVLRAGFVDFDDYHTITRNPGILNPTAHALADFWRTPRMDLYVPVTYTTWWAIARTAPLEAPAGPARPDPRSFHATNLAVHVAASLTVLALLRRLVPAGELPACAGALLFAVHPVQVEAVAWASGLKDVLGGLFCLVALWQYLAFAQCSPGRRKSVHYAFAVLAMALGTLTKPVAMVVPLMLIAVELFALRRPRRTVVSSLSPFVFLGVACAIWTAMIQPAPHLTTAAAPYLRPVVAVDALAFYLGKLLFPVHLAHDYGRTPAAVMQGKLVAVTWLAPLAVAMVVWLVRRRSPRIVVGSLLFVVPLLPVLGLVPFDFQEYSTVADHYLYLPMFGVAVIAAELVRIIRKRVSGGAAVVLAGVGAVALAGLGVMSWAQAARWRDNQTFLAHALSVNPISWSVNGSLAAIAVEQARFVDAERFARKSLESKPAYVDSLVNLGAALLAQNRAVEAIPPLESAVKLRPGFAEAWANLGNAYASVGRFENAVSAFEAALRANPNLNAVRPLLERARAIRDEQQGLFPSGR